MKIPRKYKIWRYPLLLKLCYGLKSCFNKEFYSIKYWINANTFIWDCKIKPYNWGDYVNLVLAGFISSKKVFPYLYVTSKKTIAMMGSILPWAIDENTIVWGSGCLDSNDPLWKNINKPKQVLAVRGPLTRDVLLKNSIDCPEIYGDPALLFPRYYSPQIEKKYQYGVILHVSTNITESILSKVESIYGTSVLLINPKKFNHWNEFIDSILSCKNILSSSLHGIIIADAYHIPNVWISVTNMEHPDNNFKFKDYYLSVGKDTINPIDFTNKPSIINTLETWTEPVIDLDRLLEVCPLG